MNALLRTSDRLFDALEEKWEGRAGRETIAVTLIVAFFVSLIVIEVNRQGWMPAPFAGRLPTNHFYAIDVAFSLFLVAEIVALVFGIASSVADSLGKQFEIFSLILLRQSFKELIHFDEPIHWTLDESVTREAVMLVVTDAVGALIVFAIIGYYYRLQKHRPITDTEEEKQRFVAAKKLLALTLLATLVWLCGDAAYSLATSGTASALFDTFYTVLIFSDVLIVLIALRYSSTYHVVFRNSGFAAATVMLRLALAGPRFVDAAIGIVAAIYAVGVARAYEYLMPTIAADRRAATNPRARTVEAADTETAPDAAGADDEETPPGTPVRSAV
jgi:hypothetical protein